MEQNHLWEHLPSRSFIKFAIFTIVGTMNDFTMNDITIVITTAEIDDSEYEQN